MAPCTTKPGLRLAMFDPYTPLGHTSWGPIFPAQGGRASSRGVDFMVDDSDGDDDPFDAGDDGDDDDGPDPEDDEQDNRDQRGRRDPRSRRQRDEGDDGDDDGEDYEPPTPEQWKRVTESLRKANNEAGRRRVIAKQLERLGIDGDSLDEWLLDRGIDPSNGERITDDGDGSQGDGEDGEEGRRSGRNRVETATERRRAEQRGHARAEAKYKPGMAMFATEAALHGAGWSGNDMGLVLRLIDIGAIDVEFDGEVPTVYGLDEQIEQIKKEFPSWFRGGRPAATAERRPARRAAGGVREVDGGERRRSGGRQPTWKDLVDRQLTGRGRR